MSTTLEITVGAHEDYPLQCWNRGAQSVPQFLPSDTMTAYVYRGQDQAALFSAAVNWYLAGGSQTGYDQGQILLTITSAQSATLEPNGTYTIVVWRTPALSAETSDVWRGELSVRPAAGTAIQGIGPYCTFMDMLGYAPWCKLIANSDTDQEGLYSQRWQARKWLDNLIVKAWRGGAWGVFGDASRPASQWSGWGMWRTPLPSPYLANMLAGGFVPQQNAITITSPGTGYTTAPTVTAPAPTSQPSGGGASRRASFIASLNGSGGVGAIVVGDSGLGYTAGVPLTLTFAGGGGTGAAATAKVSAGTLILRDQVIRLSAYKAISIVGTGQIGTNNQYAVYAQYFADLVSAEFQQFVAELDINGDGLADLAIPCGRTNTIYE